MLPIERAAQLKALADARQLGLNELIEGIITDGILAGEIPDATPGFDVRPVKAREPAVSFSVQGRFGFSRMRSTEARLLADALEAVADGRSVGKALDAKKRDSSFKIARKGRGLILVGEDASGEIGRHSITPGIARDLARQLRKAADQAESQF